MLKENKILAILVLGTMMGALDTTIVLLALPSMTQGLGTNLSLSIWVILVYLLIVAVATTQLGRLGDLFGRSKMFNAGFVVFTVGSVLCGLSPNVMFLIGSRALQAFGGALLEANSGAIIADTFEREKRGRAYGFIGIGWNVGAMLGIVLGGVLTTFIGWQSIFYINIPIGIVALVFGTRYLKDNNLVKEDLDLGGMALLAASLSIVSFGLIDFASMGLRSVNATMVAIGLMLIPVFLWWEGRSKAPMIPIETFRHGVLRSSILAAFLQAMGYLSVAFLMTLYLQGVRGLSPLDAALLLLPGYLVSSVLGPFMGSVSDRIGARIIATVGIALMCVTVVIYLSLTVNSPLYFVPLASLFAGVGAAMFWPANNSAVMANASPEKRGGISGLLRTMSNIGTLSSYVISITAASLAVSRQTAFSIFIGTTKLIGGVSQAFLAGLDSALLLSLVILIAAGLLSYFRGKEDRTGGWVNSEMQGHEAQPADRE